MPDQTGAMLRVNPQQIDRAVTAYEGAADRVGRIVSEIAQKGRLTVPWTQDEVSIEMARHYNEQVFDSEYSTYNALRRYEAELRAVARTLRGIRDDYRTTDAEAARTIQAAGSTGGW